ncbi:DUF3857 domain-containing protein [Flavobacterium sp.]|uniref:DUF3857 domain-containing protein n=1 Tax=Flavobacterium sp. TaxID=239 RepID=UPI0039E5AA0F
MTSKNTFCLLLLVFCSALTAQKFELGKVSLEELKQTEHPKDPSAVAAILFEKGKVDFEYSQNEGFIMFTEVKTRIKIYKKEGYEWATKEVRFYLPSNNRESVSFDDAVTYNLVNGEIVKTKLKSEGEFEEQVNKYWGKKKITMPAIKEGSVIEFSYRIKSPNYQKIADWNFQTTIPVDFSEYKVSTPEYFVYQPSYKGFVTPVTTSEKINKSIVLNSKERLYNGRTVTTNFNSDKIDYYVTQNIYTTKDLPAMKDEMYVNNINNYTCSVGFELSMTRFPNTPLKTYSTDWQTVTNTIYKAEDFGPELSKTGYFEDQISALIAGKSQEESVNLIYKHVKDNVKWNGYYSYYCDEGVKSAYKNKTGNVGEINLMLTAMMRFAGLNANPVLVSTRSNGIALFPNLTAYNYVICAVQFPDGMLLLDATEKYAVPNVLPLRDLNWFGRLIRKDGTSQEIELTPKNVSRNVVFMNYSVKGDGHAEGKYRCQLTDHKALDFRQKNCSMEKDAYLESLENDHNNIEIIDYTRENDYELSKPIVESYSFKDNKSTEIIGNKMYIDPLLFLAQNENPFRQEKREYPIDFGYPVQKKYNISIEIPEGYTVESLPKAINLSTGDEIGLFKYLIANTGNKIQITISTDINTAIVPAEYYEVIKEFYQKMIENQGQKIVLVKA